MLIVEIRFSSIIGRVIYNISRAAMRTALFIK